MILWFLTSNCQGNGTLGHNQEKKIKFDLDRHDKIKMNGNAFRRRQKNHKQNETENARSSLEISIESRDRITCRRGH